MNRRSESDLTRRGLLRRAGLGAGALALGPTLLAACGSDGSGTTTKVASAAAESPELKKLLDGITSKQVVIGNYGGTTEAARKKAFWDPFTERTGVRVVSADIPGRLGNQMLAGEVPAKWDAFHGSAAEALTAQQEGKKPLPKVPSIAYEDLIPAEFQPYMWQSFYVAYVPASLKGTFSGAGPQTWADFFDTKKFPGKRSWPGKDYTPGTREAALLALGVAPDEIYPIDIERADAKIKTIWDDLVFYDQFPQAQSFLTSKTVALSFGPNGMWKALQGKGISVDVRWTMTPILQPNGMNTMPDAPNMDAVQALAAFCAQPERQAEFAVLTNYGPPSKAAFDAMSKAEASALPNAPGRTVVAPDIKWLADNEGNLQDANKKLFAG